MRKNEIKKIFENYFNGAKNFVTPTIVGYESKKFEYSMLLIEISKGEGLFDTEVYGATFLLCDMERGEVRHRDLGLASDKKEVMDYINSLTWKDVINSHNIGETKLISNLI